MYNLQVMLQSSNNQLYHSYYLMAVCHLIVKKLDEKNFQKHTDPLAYKAGLTEEDNLVAWHVGTNMLA